MNDLGYWGGFGMGPNLQNWNCSVIFLTGEEPLPTVTTLQNPPYSIDSSKIKRVSFILLHTKKPAPVSSSTRSPPRPFVTASCRAAFLWTYLLARTMIVRRPAWSRLSNVIALLLMARWWRTVSLQFSMDSKPLSYTVECVAYPASHSMRVFVCAQLCVSLALLKEEWESRYIRFFH